MISKRNPSHAIPDTMTSASYQPSPRPISSLLLASRPASRLTVSPDWSAQGHNAIRHATRLLVHLGSSHRLIRSARCLPAPTHAAAHHLIHLIGSSPVPPRFPLCFPPSVPLASPRLTARHASRFASSHLIGSSAKSVACQPYSSHPSHRLIGSSPTPHRIRRATSRRNGARDGQSTTVKRNATTSDTSPIPQTPTPARRIAFTSCITHGHSHKHAHDKTPSICPLQRL